MAKLAFLVTRKPAMISLPVTSVTAIVAGIIILLLTIKVIQFRRADGVVLGDGDNRVLAKAIRGQSNAVEQLPIALILMGLAELQGANTLLLGVCAVVLIVGRLAHGIYFAHDGTHWRLRFYGMAMTLAAQIALIVSLFIALVT